MPADVASSRTTSPIRTDPDEMLRILEERAQLLARPVEVAGAEESTSLLVVQVGPERYAIAVTSVREIKPLAGVTSLPGMPSFWAGLVNLRGSLVPVLDLAAYLALARAEGPAGEDAKLVFVGTDGIEIALIVDAVRGIRRTPADDLRPSVSGGAEGVRIVQSVTKDLVSVLDLDYLLQDPALRVGVDVK